MSFYIGFSMSDLVVLAADQKFYHDGEYTQGRKLFPIKEKIWGLNSGAKFFGEYWLANFRRMPIFYEGAMMRFLGFIIGQNYLRIQESCCRQGQPLEGFTSIVLGGFLRGKSFICSFDCKDAFKPQFCYHGSIYSITEEHRNEIDALIKKVTQQLGSMQKLNIAARKDFLRDSIAKIFRSLGEKYKFISSEGDMVFITRDGVNQEVINYKEENKNE